MKRVQTVKLRLHKPLAPHSWADVGPRLSELASISHRVLNLTMTSLAMAAEYPDQVPAEWRSKTGKPSAYQMAASNLDKVNAERSKVRTCKWCAGTKTEPAEPPGKRTKRQPERAPGDACSRCDGLGTTKLQEVGIPSAVQSGMQRLAERRHANDRVGVLRGDRTLSSFRSPAPIPITSSGAVFSVGRGAEGYWVELPLGGQVGRVRFAVAPDGPVAWGHMRALLAEGTKLGDAKIVARRGEKRGWVVIISYSVEVAEPSQVLGPAALITVTRLGVVIQVPGSTARTLYHVDSIRRSRAQFARRRASRSRHQRDLSPGARGHGRARALEHYHAVDDAEGRWLATLCQQVAAGAVKHVVHRRASWVTVDPILGELLPMAQLRSALDWALSKAGIAPPQDFATFLQGDTAKAELA